MILLLLWLLPNHKLPQRLFIDLTILWCPRFPNTSVLPHTVSLSPNKKGAKGAFNKCEYQTQKK